MSKRDTTTNTCTKCTFFNSMKNMFGEQIPSSPGLFITWLKDNLPYVYLIMVAVDINFLNVLWLKYHIFNIKKHNDRNLTKTAVRILCHYCFSYNYIKSTVTSFKSSSRQYYFEWTLDSIFMYVSLVNITSDIWIREMRDEHSKFISFEH